jgi:uncharacterized membrane protein
MQHQFIFKKFLQYFLQGLLIIAPVAFTFYAFFSIITKIDSWLPIFSSTDNFGVTHVQNYGLGFVIIIAIVVIVGYFSSFFITGRIISFFDKILEKTPGLKHIYGTTKDFFEAFAGDKKKFTQNVLANVDDNDVWRIGFITKEDMVDFGMQGYVAVYIPTSYSVAGTVYIIPRSRIKTIPNLSSTQTMKFAVSGGVTDVNEEKDMDQISA